MQQNDFSKISLYNRCNKKIKKSQFKPICERNVIEWVINDKRWLNEMTHWAAYNEHALHVGIHDLHCSLGDTVCNSCFKTSTACIPTSRSQELWLKGKNGQWAPVKNPHPLAEPFRNAPNAVRNQTYQGLLRDLRTRSKTCRRTQSKLNLTSTSSPRLWKYLGDSWGRLCWKLPRRHAKLYFWC